MLGRNGGYADVGLSKNQDSALSSSLQQLRRPSPTYRGPPTSTQIIGTLAVGILIQRIKLLPENIEGAGMRRERAAWVWPDGTRDDRSFESHSTHRSSSSVDILIFNLHISLSVQKQKGVAWISWLPSPCFLEYDWEMAVPFVAWPMKLWKTGEYPDEAISSQCSST